MDEMNEMQAPSASSKKEIFAGVGLFLFLGLFLSFLETPHEWGWIDRSGALGSYLLAMPFIIPATGYAIGWIQPLAFLSYQSYARSADYYTRALDTKVLAHAPELYVGSNITLTVRSKRYEVTPAGYVYKIGKVKFRSPKIVHLENFQVTGTLIRKNNQLWIQPSLKSQ